jgi:hypothetical protein
MDGYRKRKSRFFELGSSEEQYGRMNRCQRIVQTILHSI